MKDCTAHAGSICDCFCELYAVQSDKNLILARKTTGENRQSACFRRSAVGCHRHSRVGYVVSRRGIGLLHRAI